MPFLTGLSTGGFATRVTSVITIALAGLGAAQVIRLAAGLTDDWWLVGFSLFLMVAMFAASRLFALGDELHDAVATGRHVPRQTWLSVASAVVVALGASLIAFGSITGHVIFMALGFIVIVAAAIVPIVSAPPIPPFRLDDRD